MHVELFPRLFVFAFPVDELGEVAVRSAGVVGRTSIARNSERFLLCQKQFNMFELGVKVYSFVRRGGRLALAGLRNGDNGEGSG